jgi:lipopolysaccharide transport system ATP-binding protein
VRGLSKSYQIAHNVERSTTMAEAVVRKLRSPFKRVEKETFWALSDVSFDIKKGEVVGVIGRNGAGKSTLLKILSRITEPTKGEIDLYGRVGSLLEVGTGFHPELTGRENIYLNGGILGMRRQEIERQFDAIVDFAEVAKFLDTPVKRYSSGMYVRLAFAVAAHLNSDILIVDEVLAVGDSEFQKKCLGKMQDVSHRQGRTVLFVSHSMSAIQQLCSRVLLLKSGAIDFDGSVSEGASRYLSDASTARDGIFDLTDHPSRAAGMQKIIKGLEIRSDHRRTTLLTPDSTIEFRIALELPNEIAEPRVAVAIEDSFGRRITTMASYFGGQQLPTLKGSATVVCRTGALNLGSGRYLVSVSVADKLTGLLDSIDMAGWIDVEWNNNFGNGEHYKPVYGPILRESRWEISNELPLTIVAQ